MSVIAEYALHESLNCDKKQHRMNSVHRQHSKHATPHSTFCASYITSSLEAASNSPDHQANKTLKGKDKTGQNVLEPNRGHILVVILKSALSTVERPQNSILFHQHNTQTASLSTTDFVHLLIRYTNF